MSNNPETTVEKINTVALQAGLALMAVAATVGMIELPEHPHAKIALSAQPSFVLATAEAGGNGSNAQRRERDESAPHLISYSAIQRTPGRSGKQ